MGDQVTLPGIGDVRELFEMLVGTGVETTEGERCFPTTETRCVVATYTEDDGQLVGVMVAPLDLTIVLGGCLSDLPKSTIDDLVEAKKLDGPTRDNAAEVFNVSASLLNRAGGAHVVYKELMVWPLPLPKDVVACLTRPRHRLDVSVHLSEREAESISIYLV